MSMTLEPSVLHLLRRHAVDRAERTAVTFVHDFDAADGSRSLNYAELDAEARRVASWLQERCAPGDRVLLLHPAGLPFVTAFLACLYAGVIAVPSPMPGQFQYQQRRVTMIARDAGVSVALTDMGQLPEAQQWIADTGLELPVAASDAPASVTRRAGTTPAPPPRTWCSCSTPPARPVTPRASWSRTPTCCTTRTV